MKNNKNDLITNLIDFFKKTKKKYTNYQFIFLSKRFLKTYYILQERYPEIQLPNYALLEEMTNIPKDKIIYLNDINYELPEKIGYRSYVTTYATAQNFIPEDNLNIILKYSREDIKKEKYNVLKTKKFESKNKYHSYEWCTYRMMIDILAQEISFLSRNNISNTLDLVPDIIQKYFNFYANNQEQLEYFIYNLYNREFLYPGLNTGKYRQEEKYALIQEIVEKFGIENIRPELKLWLITTDTACYSMLHTSIKKDNYIINDNLSNYEKVKIEERFLNYLIEIKKTGTAPLPQEEIEYMKRIQLVFEDHFNKKNKINFNVPTYFSMTKIKKKKK